MLPPLVQPLLIPLVFDPSISSTLYISYITYGLKINLERGTPSKLRVKISGRRNIYPSFHGTY
jgi:hypothetical protein